MHRRVEEKGRVDLGAGTYGSRKQRRGHVLVGRVCPAAEVVAHRGPRHDACPSCARAAMQHREAIVLFEQNRLG